MLKLISIIEKNKQEIEKLINNFFVKQIIIVNVILIFGFVITSLNSKLSNRITTIIVWSIIGSIFTILIPLINKIVNNKKFLIKIYFLISAVECTILSYLVRERGGVLVGFLVVVFSVVFIVYMDRKIMYLWLGLAIIINMLFYLTNINREIILGKGFYIGGILLSAIFTYVCINLINIFKRFINRLYEQTGEIISQKNELIFQHQQLENYERELKKTNENLEKKVKDRTKEIEKTNKLLKLEIREREKIERELIELNKNLEIRIMDSIEELRKEIETKEVIQNQLLKEKEKAEDANDSKSNFLANMSHEIRTPMNGIIGIAELLSVTKLDEKQKKFINLIQSSSNALLRILEDILDYTKLEFGTLYVESKAFNLKSLILEIFELFKISVDEKKIELILKYNKDVPDFILSDTVRIRQILINLIGNAIKFTEIGKVIVHVETAEGNNFNKKILFTIEDTGIGIPKEKYNILFKQFTQVDVSHSRKYGGTGLGLPISKKLVELLDGEIWFESVIEKGSKFMFTIEVKEAVIELNTVQEIKSNSVCSLKNNDNNIKVLVVEDDEVNRLVITEFLKEKKINSISAKNGLEALKILKKQKVEVIFMDIQMPVLDGIATARIIRNKEKNEGTQRIPIIAVTAYSMYSDRENIKNVGIDDYISKPIDYEKLEMVIEKYLMICK